MDVQREELTLHANGRPLNAYLVSPANLGPGVLVLPSWWGLKPYFREVCDRLADHGYTALAPDYYHGRLATTVEEATTLQQEVEGDMDAMAAMMKAASDHLINLRPGRPLAAVGFSMGTDWALLTASKQSEITAVVVFYGFYGVEFKGSKPKVLAHFAEKDEWQPVDAVTAAAQNMKDAGLDITVHVYPGAAHWFMEEDRPEYDPAAAKLAWDRTLAFLEQNLTK